jgi:hypothetical protein
VVYERRRQWYDECSRYTFPIMHGDMDFKRIGGELLHFIRRILGYIPVLNYDDLNTSTFFLCLTYKRVEDAISVWNQLTRGVDAIELRVDLLDKHHDHQVVKRQLALLRRLTTLPIIYTVRSVCEGGSFVGTDEVFKNLCTLFFSRQQQVKYDPFLLFDYVIGSLSIITIRYTSRVSFHRRRIPTLIWCASVNPNPTSITIVRYDNTDDSITTCHDAILETTCNGT